MTEKNFENEEWRAVNVKGYEEFYAVSSLGRVKSVERTVVRSNGRKQHIKEKILKPTISGRKGNQYLAVGLHKNGTIKTVGVHVLVALAFPEICGEPFEGADVNHIDENHFNNVPENLNWLSHKDNINHGTRNERAAKARINHPDLSKTVYQYSKSYELVKEWQSTMEVARQTGWHQQAISLCCNNHYNPNGTGAHNVYKNYIWSYTPL